MKRNLFKDSRILLNPRNIIDYNFANFYVKNLILAFLLLIVSNIGYGQNRIYNDVQTAKKSKTKFHEKEIFKVLEEDYSREGVFHNLDEVHLIKLNLGTKEVSNSAISFKIPLGSKIVDIDLLEVSDSFYDYEVTNEKEERFFVNKSLSRHFRGVIRGEINSLVAISFFDEKVMGIISNDDGNHNIGKIDDSDQLIIYSERNLIEYYNLKGGCAADDMNDNSNEPIEYDPNVLLQNSRFSSAPDTNCVRLYFETQYDIYQSLGIHQDTAKNIQEVEYYVTSLYNQVALIYYNEGISTSLSEIKVWTVTDPYIVPLGSYPILTLFKANTGAFNGDLGQLLSFTNSQGFNIGLAASLAGLCNSDTDNSLCISTGLSSTITNFPIYSFNVQIIAHEFGHLMGSQHTHACAWNGTATPIDGCNSCQTSVGLPGCNNCIKPPLPPIGSGTIMSYCDLNSVGINFSNGFGLQPGNLIRHNVANSSCLSNCSGCPAGTTAFDIYSQDRPTTAGVAFDTGVEPNPDNGPMWLSEDIWIRQNLDNGTKPQNAEFKQYSPNGVYVKVRNLSSVASDCAELKVYFSKASTGLTWPTHFYDYYQNVGTASILHGDIIGTAIIPQIPANGTVTIEIPWYPPNPIDYTNDKHHFCLVSRIISPNDPMANEVATWVGSNAKNNNNIAWKNISVHNTNVSNAPPPPVSPISVFTRGINEESDFTDIRFVDEGFGEEIERRFFDIGKVNVELEPELFQRMLGNGSLEGEGIEVVEENKVQVFMRDAVFRNIPIGFNETFYMKFDFLFSEEIEVEEQIILDVVQQNPETEKLEGGERFLIVNEGADEEEARTEAPALSFEITPNPNNGIFIIEHEDIESGSYNIFDLYGNVILSGKIEDAKEIVIDLTREKSGMYYINLTAGRVNLSKTLVKR